nr:hypothetical protein CFP56_74832 [Quercus suber]
MAIGIEENRDLARVELEAPNLCSVHIVQTSCEINLVHCKNLKKLKLQACITDDWLNDHLSELPLIETLELACCSLLKRIEISSDQLKSLALLACWNLVEVKLDAPKLCRFNHYTRSVISLSSSNALNLSVATYGMISRDDPWNVKKIEFLSKLSNSKLLSLSLQSAENAIIPKRLRKTVSSPAYNVKHLHLFLSSPLSFTRYAIGLGNLWIACFGFLLFWTF